MEESEDWSSWGTVASRANFQPELALAGDELVQYGRGAALLSDAGMRVRWAPDPTWHPDLLSFDSSSSKYARTTRGVADAQAGDEPTMVRREVCPDLGPYRNVSDLAENGHLGHFTTKSSIDELVVKTVHLLVLMDGLVVN